MRDGRLARALTRSSGFTVRLSSENDGLTGASDSTQVSFDRPPRCIAIPREWLSVATRVSPPGITR